MSSLVTNRLADTYHSVVDRGYGIVVVVVAAALALVAGVLIGMALSGSASDTGFDRFGSSVVSIGGEGSPRQGGR